MSLSYEPWAKMTDVTSRLKDVQAGRQLSSSLSVTAAAEVMWSDGRAAKCKQPEPQGHLLEQLPWRVAQRLGLCGLLEKERNYYYFRPLRFVGYFVTIAYPKLMVKQCSK